MIAYLSRRIRHFFHMVSNVRPIIWISMYVALTPVFALIYWALPDSQFRIPDGAGTDFGSWLYYSMSPKIISPWMPMQLQLREPTKFSTPRMPSQARGEQSLRNQSMSPGGWKSICVEMEVRH